MANSTVIVTLTLVHSSGNKNSVDIPLREFAHFENAVTFLEKLKEIIRVINKLLD